MQQNFELSILLRDHAQKLANQGVQTGQDAGFLPDKKTIQRAVDALEEMGLVKVLKTAIVDGNRKNSLQQPTTIIYLPEKSQEEINAFIESLHKPYKQTQILSSARAVLDGVEYSKMSKARRKKRDKEKDEEVHEVDVLDMMGPRRQFLEDRQTVAQLFGFLLGRQRRAQELHLYTLNHILSDSPADTVISVEQRIISSKFWKEDYPLGSFCAIIPAQSYIPYLESAQHDPVALNQSLKSLDVRLQRALKVQHARTRHRLLDLLRLLTCLRLITPLQEDDAGSIVMEGSNEGSEEVSSRRFEPVEMPQGKSADLPDYWIFSGHAPVWLLSSAKFTSQKIEEAPPFYADVPLSSVEDAAAYWSLLRKLCDRQSNLSLGDTPGGSGSAVQPFTIPAAELASLCNYRSWTSDYRLSKLQQEYLKGMIDIATLSTPLDDPARLMQAAFITCAPQQVVYEYFSAQKEKLVGAATRIERRRLRADGSSRQAMKRALSAKAEKHLQNIGSQWDEIVAELVDGDLTPEEEEQLRPLRSRYITVGGQVDREKVKALISNIVRNPVRSAKKRHKKLTNKTLLPRSVEVEHIEEAMPDIEVLFTHRTVPLPPFVNHPSTEDGFPPLPLIVNPLHERKVADLVSGMGPAPQEPLAPRKKTTGPKGKFALEWLITLR
jgi:transcription factor C subunit 3